MMTANDRPQWLSNALAASARTRVVPQATEVIAPGDIRVLTLGRTGRGDNRLVLVLSVNESQQTASVTLTSSETEYACDWDFILEIADSNLPYRLMVETDIVSTVWLKQLRLQVGKLRDAVFDEIRSWTPERSDSWLTDPDRHGPPIRGRFDPRWTYREQELDALNVLAQDCLTRLLEGATVDPALLAVLPRLNESERQALLFALVASGELNGVSIHETSLELLAQYVDTFDPDSWAALEPLLNSASSRASFEISESLATLVGSRESMDDVEYARNSIFAAEIRRGRSVLHVVSETSAWPELETMRVALSEGGEMMILPERLNV